MRERLYRAHILIEQGQRKTLAQIARQEGRSISDLVRELIRRGLQARSDTPERRWRKRDRVLAWAARQRKAMRLRRGGQPIDLDPTAVLQSMREERDAGFSLGTADTSD